MENLFKFMKERGITAKALSDMTGISTGNISDWKSGRCLPTIPALIKLSEALNVSIDYLVGNTNCRVYTPPEYETLRRNAAETVFIDDFNYKFECITAWMDKCAEILENSKDFSGDIADKVVSLIKNGLGFSMDFTNNPAAAVKRANEIQTYMDKVKNTIISDVPNVVVQDAVLFLEWVNPMHHTLSVEESPDYYMVCGYPDLLEKYKALESEDQKRVDLLLGIFCDIWAHDCY